jgi:hypothetical protein
MIDGTGVGVGADYGGRGGLGLGSCHTKVGLVLQAFHTRSSAPRSRPRDRLQQPGEITGLCCTDDDGAGGGLGADWRAGWMGLDSCDTSVQLGLQGSMAVPPRPQVGSDLA